MSGVDWHRIEIPASGARSLVWVGGELRDVADGWTRFPLDGSAPERRYSSYGKRFDTAVVSPQGDVVALVESAGTKGLVFESDGLLVREVNRSFYRADAYRFPLTLFTLPNGRTGVAHCPNLYNQIEIEDARTGEPLTVHGERKPADFFHSRLAVSRSGRYLMSAGWVWHPWSCLSTFDLHDALADPRSLDTVRSGVFGMFGLIQAEISGACFSNDDIVLSTSPEENDPEGPDDLAPNMLARWSISERRFTWRKRLDECAGDLLPFGDGVLSLYRHPRLYDAATGDLVAEWPDLATGEADGSIVRDKGFSGPARVAVDERGRRFAVTDGERIVVVQAA